MRALIGIVLAIAGVAAHAKPLISDGDVSVEQVGGCDEAVALQVNAPNGDYFAKDVVALQKLLGGARMVLSFQCSGFTSIEVAGMAGGAQVYTGSMAAASGWQLQGNAQTSPIAAAPAPAVAAPTAPAAPQTVPAKPAPVAAGGFGAPEPDYLGAFHMVMAAHPDILADDNRWVKAYASYHLFDTFETCREWSSVEGKNLLTWKKNLDEARDKFRAALAKSANGPTTTTYTLTQGSFYATYDSAKGGFPVQNMFNSNDGTVHWLPLTKDYDNPASCMTVPRIPIRLTNMPLKPEWFIALGEADAERLIDSTSNLHTLVKQGENARVMAAVQVVVQTLPPVLSGGEVHIPAKVLQMRLAVVKTTTPKPAPLKPGQLKPRLGKPFLSVSWTHPLGFPINMGGAPEVAAPGKRAVPTLDRSDFFLAALKDHPQLLTDEVLLRLTQTQVRVEQSLYKSIDNLQKQQQMQKKTPYAENLFVWEKVRTARPAAAIGATDALLHAKPDWSYLEKAGFDPRKESIVGNFLFARETIEGKDPNFAQHELKEVMREFLTAAADRAQRQYAVEFEVPIAYQFSSQILSFDLAKGLREIEPLYFGTLPEGNRQSIVLVYPDDVRNEWLYGPALSHSEAVGRPTEGIRHIRRIIGLPYQSATVSFKQRVKLTDITVPVAKAQQFVQEQRLKARLIATFDSASLGSYYNSGKPGSPVPVLHGTVDRIEFEDRAGNVQITKADFKSESTRIEFVQASTATPDPIVFTRDVMDLILLNNAPDKVSDDYLFNMMLARYSTDAGCLQNDKRCLQKLDAGQEGVGEQDNWLRFFAPVSEAGRQPRELEMRALMPRFKSWAQGRAVLAKEVVAVVYLEVTAGNPPVVTPQWNSPQSCLVPGLSAFAKPDPEHTVFAAGPCGKRGKLAGEVRGLPGIKHTPIGTRHKIQISGQIPTTAAVAAGGRENVTAELYLSFTGVTTQPKGDATHEAVLSEIRYLDPSSGAEIARISAAEATAMFQAASNAVASQRAACEALASVDEQMACFNENCGTFFDDHNQCQSHIRNLRSAQRQHVQGCNERTGDYGLVNATPAYEAAVQQCLTTPPRGAEGPDVLGIQIGMGLTRADQLVRVALDMTSQSRGFAMSLDGRPFTYNMLYHTEDFSHAVALFYLKMWGPQTRDDEMQMGTLIAGISRKVHFENPPPAGAIRDGLIKKYGKPTWENGGTEMMWANSASCRGINELLHPLEWGARYWPAERTVRMVSPDGPQAAFDAYKDCGTVVFANLIGNDLETLALNPDWFRYLPEKAFKVERSSELQF